MKAKTLRLLTLPLLLGMTACDTESGTYFLCITKNTENSISKEYDKFTGKSNFERTFKVETTIDVVTTTKSGNLLLKISSNDDGKEYYSGNLTEDFSFKVNVPSGKYSLHVEGTEHSGSYKFEWYDKVAA